MNPAVKGFAPDALGRDRRLGLAGQCPRAGEPVKRAVIMADGKLVTAADLDLAGPTATTICRSTSRPRARPPTASVIRQALARTEGNISGTAKLLGISRPTLYDLLKQYGLQA